jgi:2',3'-cyclic-nucleotide 2'-phosphodiesterase (5'-nucleotidase family)
MRTTFILLAVIASAFGQDAHTQQLRGDRFLSVSAKTSAKSSKAKSSKTADAKAEKVASAKATKALKTKSEKMSVSAKAAKAGGNIAEPVDPNPPTPIIVGKTVYPLNGELEVIRRRETNLGQLVADSYIWFINGYLNASGSADNNLPAKADIALKNAGAIRASIDGPDVSISDIEAALKFNNKLSVIKVTVPQLLAAMENAVSSYPKVDGKGGPGHFPQITGMDITFDPSNQGVNGTEEMTKPSRVVSMKVGEDLIVENGEVVDAMLAKSYVMATTDYLSEGGSEFASLAAAEKLGNTGTSEQYALADYIETALKGQVDIRDPPPNERVKCVGTQCV